MRADIRRALPMPSALLLSFTTALCVRACRGDRVHCASGALCIRVLSEQEPSETPPEGSADSLPSGKSAGLGVCALPIWRIVPRTIFINVVH